MKSVKMTTTITMIGILAMTTTTMVSSFAPPAARTLTNNPILGPVLVAGPKRPETYYNVMSISHSSSISRKPETSIFQTASVGGTAAEEAGDDANPSQTSGGTATIPQLIFNLVKSIVGAGVLGLPAGIVAFGNAPSAVIPAAILIVAIGGLSGYGFGLIGRSCAYTGTKSFREAWAASVSPDTSWIPAVSVTFKTICAVLAYSMILGDTFSSLFAGAGWSISSSTSLLGVTSLVLLPLCLLKNLSSLAPFSLLGSCGMIYTAIAMSIRYFQKAYSKGGKFFDAVAPSLQPSFGTVGAKGALSPSTAILVAMLSTAYMAHFNAPKFYTELKNNTEERFLKVVKASFGISIGIFAVMTSIGFLTFGGACKGVILNNYANADTLMGISRIAVAISLVGSYPLAFVGARDGVLDLFKIKDRSNLTLNSLTVALLAGVTGLALVIPDVTFVLSFAGATLGNALIYVYPAMMFRGSVKKMKNASGALKREVNLAMGSAALGIAMGALGAKMALKTLTG